MKKILSFVFPVVMIVFGIIAIVSGAKKLGAKHLYDASATAVITGIQQEWSGTDEDGFDQYDYHVYVKYEAGGKEYEAEYPGYNSKMKDGDEIEILYQSSDPTKISEKNITGNSVLFIVIGAVLSLAGVFLVIRAFIKR